MQSRQLWVCRDLPRSDHGGTLQGIGMSRRPRAQGLTGSDNLHYRIASNECSARRRVFSATGPIPSNHATRDVLTHSETTSGETGG